MVFVFSSVASLHAEEFRLKSTLSSGVVDWNSGDSYVGGVAPSGASDTVVIPAGLTAELRSDDAGSWSRVSSLSAVLVSSGAVFRVNALSDAVLGCGAYLNGDASGRMQKVGGGRLTLTAADADAASAVGYYGDYNLNIDVSEGVLAFPSGVSGAQKFRYRTLSCAEGAKIVVPSPNEINVSAGLSGAGTITNEAASQVKMVVTCLEHCTYSGTIDGTIRFDVNGGRLDLTSTKSTYSGASVLFSNTTVGFMTGGVGGTVNVPSSFGYGSVNTSGSNVRLLYLGTGGDVITRAIYGGGALEQIYDAGANGNLTISSYIGAPGKKLSRLVFDGSNTVESVFSGNIGQEGGSDAWPRIVKRGTGTWRIEENAKRKNAGVVAVENGTLRFGSIAQAGTNCAFGLSTELYEDYTGVLDPSRTTPYAFVLGGGTDAAPTEGILEYSGSGSAYCTTRLAGIKTVGGFNSGAMPLRFKGFAAAEPGNKTLVLGGASNDENIAHTITDGDGTLSVRKRGVGTWYLDGELSFSGSLSVDQGTLVVRSPVEKYSYYRLTIREIGYGCSAYDDITVPSALSDFERRSVCVTEFPLYNADGVQQNVMSVSNLVWTKIAPGGFGFGKDGFSSQIVGGSSSKPLGFMFSHSGAMAYMQFPATPRLDDPETWTPIVMRLRDDADEITHFDMYLQYKTGSAPYCGRNPTAISLEGSADGVDWDMLYENDAIAIPEASDTQWISGNASGSPTSATRMGLGIAIRGRRASMPTYAILDNVSAVSVAPGATLRAENGSPEISRLHVGASGAGTIDGFTFAENGEIDVDGISSGVTDVPIGWNGCTGMNRVAGWSVKSQGRTRKCHVDVTETGLRITMSGLVITVQ